MISAYVFAALAALWIVTFAGWLLMFTQMSAMARETRRIALLAIEERNDVIQASRDAVIEADFTAEDAPGRPLDVAHG